MEQENNIKLGSSQSQQTVCDKPFLNEEKLELTSECVSDAPAGSNLDATLKQDQQISHSTNAKHPPSNKILQDILQGFDIEMKDISNDDFTDPLCPPDLKSEANCLPQLQDLCIQSEGHHEIEQTTLVTNQDNNQIQRKNLQQNDDRDRLGLHREVSFSGFNALGSFLASKSSVPQISHGCVKEQQKIGDQTQIKKLEQIVQNYKASANNESFEDSLRCDEHYGPSSEVKDQLIAEPTTPQLTQTQNQIETLQEQTNLPNQGAKNHFTLNSLPLEQKVEKPFISKISNNEPSNDHCKEEAIPTAQGASSNGEGTGGFISQAVSPNQPHAKYISSKLSPGQEAVLPTKSLIMQNHTPQKDKLRIHQQSFSFSALSPLSKSPLQQSHLQLSNHHDKSFLSPDHTNKNIYNMQCQSGKKVNDLISSSPLDLKPTLNIFSQTTQNQQQPLPKEQILTQQNTTMVAPSAVHTPVKRRYSSPEHVQTCSKDDQDQISDPDPRFSSNTTKKYITKTSKGSIIHSDFKINHNSLQKVPKIKEQKKPSDQSSIYANPIPYINQETQPRFIGIQMASSNTNKRQQYENLNAQQLLNYNVDNYNNGHAHGYNYNNVQHSPVVTQRIQKNFKVQTNLSNFNSSQKMNELQTPLFAKKQRGYPTLMRIGEQFQISEERNIEKFQGTSDKQFISEISSSYDENSNSGSSSSENTSSSGSRGQISSSCSDQNKRQIFNLSQPQKFQLDNGLFTQIGGSGAYGQGFGQSFINPSGLYSVSKNDMGRYNMQQQSMASFFHMHPLNQGAAHMKQVLTDHQQHFNPLQSSEFAHHPHHSTATNHVPGCTLKCSCGLWNAQAMVHPNIGMKVRSRLNSECSPQKSPNPISSLSKGLSTFNQSKLNQPNFYNPSGLGNCMSPFNQQPQIGLNFGILGQNIGQLQQNLSQLGIGTHQQFQQSTYQTRIAENVNSSLKKKNKKSSHKKHRKSHQNKQSSKKMRNEEGEQVVQTPAKIQNQQIEHKKRKIKSLSKRIASSFQSQESNHELKIEGGSWQTSSQEQKSQLSTPKNNSFPKQVSKAKKQTASRSKTKIQLTHEFFEPEQIYQVKDQDLNNEDLKKEAILIQHFTPQKNQDYQHSGNNTQNRQTLTVAQMQTQMKTMDTLNSRSNLKDQYHLYRTPGSLDNVKIAKYSSNVKDTYNHKLIDQDQSHQIHYTGQKPGHDQQQDDKNFILNIKSRGGTAQKSNRLQTSKISNLDKDLINMKNEENINEMTEQIMRETLSQKDFFEKISHLEPKMQQCQGCKCKNTKCLKLYCECLRNKATCGPTCQCKNGDSLCFNNDDHIPERKEAIRDILKRNIMAFENKVNKDGSQHFKGCKCKASFCQKKYCECYERNVKCTDKCKCLQCKNKEDCTRHQSSMDKEMVESNMSNRNGESGQMMSNQQVDIDMDASNDLMVNSSKVKQSHPNHGFINRFQQRNFEPDQELFITSVVHDKNMQYPVIVNDQASFDPTQNEEKENQFPNERNQDPIPKAPILIEESESLQAKNNHQIQNESLCDQSNEDQAKKSIQKLGGKAGRKAKPKKAAPIIRKDSAEADTTKTIDQQLSKQATKPISENLLGKRSVGTLPKAQKNEKMQTRSSKRIKQMKQV